MDRQSVGVVGIIMARRPFDIGTGIEAARMLVEQFGAQIMLRHAGDTIVAVDRVIVEEEITVGRSEEHTSELQSLMRISYAVFCLKKQNINTSTNTSTTHTNNPTYTFNLSSLASKL